MYVNIQFPALHTPFNCTFVIRELKGITYFFRNFYFSFLFFKMASSSKLMTYSGFYTSILSGVSLIHVEQCLINVQYTIFIYYFRILFSYIIFMSLFNFNNCTVACYLLFGQNKMNSDSDSVAQEASRHEKDNGCRRRGSLGGREKPNLAAG